MYELSPHNGRKSFYGTATVMECSSKTIKNWISGRTKPTIRHLFAFAKEMNVSIDDIIVIR